MLVAEQGFRAGADQDYSFVEIVLILMEFLGSFCKIMGPLYRYTILFVSNHSER